VESLKARAMEPLGANVLTSATSTNERGKIVTVANQRTSFAYATNHPLLTGRDDGGEVASRLRVGQTWEKASTGPRICHGPGH